LANAGLLTHSALAEVFRREAGRVTGTLVGRFRDFGLAEESTQDAVLAALETWPRDGVPDRPARGC
jgi:RNA polymerase sigma-70 factor (ECF subfamily)